MWQMKDLEAQSAAAQAQLGPVEHVDGGVARAVVREDDLGLDGACAEVLRAARQRRLDAPGLVEGRQDQAKDRGLARGSAAPEAASAASSRPAALVPVLVARPLRALALLIPVAALAHRAYREVHSTHPVDLGDLDRYGVADVHDVLDPVLSIGRELADPDQDFLPGQILDEGADSHDSGDLALVDLANLGLLGEPFDHRSRLFTALRLCAGDAHGAVVLELDGRAGLGLDLADHLAAWTDDLAHLVGRDLDRLDARRVWCTGTLPSSGSPGGARVPRAHRGRSRVGPRRAAAGPRRPSTAGSCSGA